MCLAYMIYIFAWSKSVCSLQGVPNSEDYEFLKSQLQLWSKICKVSTYIRTCTARVCHGSLPTVVCACWRLHCKYVVCELVWLALATMTLNSSDYLLSGWQWSDNCSLGQSKPQLHDIRESPALQQGQGPRSQLEVQVCGTHQRSVYSSARESPLNEGVVLHLGWNVIVHWFLMLHIVPQVLQCEYKNIAHHFVSMCTEL